MPANSVSTDGYVHVTVSLAPWVIDYTMNLISYKIPVDYPQNKIDDSQMVNIYNRSEMSLSCSVAIFKANAQRMNNGDVIVYVETEHMDANFEHLAVSKDNTIYMPQKNTWFNVVPYPANNYSSRFIIPADKVGANGDLYFSIYIDIPIGITKVINAKLPVD